MTVEIKNDGEIITDSNGNKWLPVLISFNGLSQINKIILGDEVDDDNKSQLELRNQIHKDCLELIKEFKK